LPALDNSLFYFINNGLSNGFLNTVMPWLSNMGTREFLIVAGIALLFGKDRKFKIAGITLIVGLFICRSAVYSLKMWIARPRPFLVLAHVHVLAKEMSFSFPSGHSTNIFMAAALLSAYSRKCRYFYILAFVVGISRIYLGVHYPSDVLGGALLGIALGAGLGWISRIALKQES